jgi:hypothetical protein
MQHPSLENRAGTEGHADRCWLDPDRKKAVRTIASGDIGLEAA